LNPVERALNGALPAGVLALALVGIHRPAQRSRSSSWSAQKPVASPAAKAAPSAVVSATSGRMTGTPSTSAWNCISRSLAVMPPSTRSSVNGTSATALAASTTSRLCQAAASSAARAMCPRFAYAVRPTMIPRASSRQ
jgi:hypothetical protein